MADEDKQFEATPQKLQKARKEGQVVKSKDFSMAIFILVMFSVLFIIAPQVWSQISGMFILIYEQIPNRSLEEINVLYIFFICGVTFTYLVGPALLIAFSIAIAADFIQVGPLLTLKPLMPKLEKLNPIKGFKNIFSQRTVIELVKNVLKVIIFSIVAYLVFIKHLPVLLTLAATENAFSLMVELGSLLFDFVLQATIFFLILSGGDYMYQKWKFLKDQKMSFKEIKDEYKNSEGDPHVKAALRQKREELLRQSMLEAVPTADVVITNPTHIANALKYNKDTMEAPILLAKGTELFAQRIIDIAREHRIPVIENKPVAQALFRMVEIGMQIPPNLYKAVAEIFMFVYNLQARENIK